MDRHQWVHQCVPGYKLATTRLRCACPRVPPVPRVGIRCKAQNQHVNTGTGKAFVRQSSNDWCIGTLPLPWRHLFVSIYTKESLYSKSLYTRSCSNMPPDLKGLNKAKKSTNENSLDSLFLGEVQWLRRTIYPYDWVQVDGCRRISHSVGKH